MRRMKRPPSPLSSARLARRRASGAASVEEAVAQILCQQGAAGIYRLVDAVSKMKGVRKALGLKHAPRPGSEEWWEAYDAIIEAVRALEARGLVEYIPAAGIARWKAGGCT